MEKDMFWFYSRPTSEVIGYWNATIQRNSLHPTSFPWFLPKHASILCYWTEHSTCGQVVKMSVTPRFQRYSREVAGPAKLLSHDYGPDISNQQFAREQWSRESCDLVRAVISREHHHNSTISPRQTIHDLSTSLTEHLNNELSFLVQNNL